MGLEQEVVELVAALIDTGVVTTTYSCRGHFDLRGNSAFCHHNQKAQVHLQVKDLAKAAALCDEILREVQVEGIEVEVRQRVNHGPPDEPIEIDWMLEFRPRGFWDMRPQDTGMLITVADGWTDEKARRLIGEAFTATIEVCKNGRWKSGQDETSEVEG
jgi:hypothetical protein